MRFLIFLISLSIVNNDPIRTFCESFCRQYEKDVEIRKLSRSLIYIPEIMNLIDDKDFRNMSISQRRDDLFSLLSERELFFCHTTAIDTTSGHFFHNVNGDMSYFFRKKKLKDSFVEVDVSRLDRDYSKMVSSLISYVRLHKIDYIFYIAELVDMNTPGLFWVISNNSLFVIRYDTQTDCFKEIPVRDYLLTYATDDVFDFNLRLISLSKSDIIQ